MEESIENIEFEPIVFVNSPITNLDDDIVGFNTQVKTIEKGIEDGATMIGIVADYGTGKSSVTDILSEIIINKPYKYPKPIRINMWDCLQNRQIENDDVIVSNEIGDLTKSFLFQLANGKNRKLASYVNKRLSNNYGLLSIGFSSKFSWLFLIVAVLSFAISKISSLDKIYVPTFANEWLTNIGKIIYDASPIFLGFAIIFAAIGISFSSIAFSHWKMEKKNNNEVNDIFDTYEYIINKLRPLSNKIRLKKSKKNRKIKKQIIIIEDLDRISDKSIIIGFLKEIYRFQTSLETIKDEFVFIISIKPESMLRKVDGHAFEFDDDKIYSKIFDLTLSLKPIHFDDYDSILLQLLKSNPNKKTQLEKLINCEEIKDSLPSSFKWIKKGSNLTIRELKDRLNSAIEIMVFLKNKQYKGNSSANFEACTAVSYLEHQFPDEYNRLITNEVAFSELIEESYNIKNTNNDKNKIGDEILNTISKKYDSQENNEADYIKEEFSDLFKNDLKDLIYIGLFDKDFRMYFYSYPKNSHIKTTEEKYLCDLLELPYDKIDVNKLDSSIDNVYSTGENNVVTETLSKNFSTFPDVVLLNDKLLAVSTKINPKAVIDSLYVNVFANIDSESIYRDYSVNILKRVRNLDNRNAIIKGLIDDLLLFSDIEKFILSRKLLISTFNIEVLLFEELFFSDVMITKDEIVMISSPRVSSKLVNPETADENNYEYISSLLTSVDLKNKDEEAFKNAVETFRKYCTVVSSEVIANDLLKFMRINSFIDKDFFNVVIKEATYSVNKTDIANYLNSIPINDLILGDYMEPIDSLGFSKDINFNIVKKLIELNLYYTPLLYCSNNNKLGEIPFDNKPEEMIDEIKYVQGVSLDAFYNIRKHIIYKNLVIEYKEIFFGGFNFITKEEYLLIDNTIMSIEFIDTGYIEDDTIDEVCDILNSKKYNREETKYLFEYFFNPDVNDDCIVDERVIISFISRLNFKESIDFNLLLENERDIVVNYFSSALSLDNPTKALNFMKNTESLVPSLEIIVQKSGTLDDDYVNLLNNLNSYTDKTIEWIINKYIHFELPPSICDVLYEEGHFYEYIPAVSLRINELIIDEKIDFEHYVDVYEDVDEMLDLMSKNYWFLEKLRDSGKYSRLKQAQLRALYKIEQTEQLFKYVFENSDDEEKMYYLNNYYNFKTEEDSKKFQLMICQPDNLELLGDVNLFYKIKHSLWESNPTHKAQFTRLWNVRWKKELIGD